VGTSISLLSVPNPCSRRYRKCWRCTGNSSELFSRLPSTLSHWQRSASFCFPVVWNKGYVGLAISSSSFFTQIVCFSPRHYCYGEGRAARLLIALSHSPYRSLALTSIHAAIRFSPRVKRPLTTDIHSGGLRRNHGQERDGNSC
jgi:hypothetical protein